MALLFIKKTILEENWKANIISGFTLYLAIPIATLISPLAVLSMFFDKSKK